MLIGYAGDIARFRRTAIKSEHSTAPLRVEELLVRPAPGESVYPSAATAT